MREILKQASRDKRMLSQTRSNLNSPRSLLRGVMDDPGSTVNFTEAATGDHKYLAFGGNGVFDHIDIGVATPVTESSTTVNSIVMKEKTRSLNGVGKNVVKIILEMNIQFGRFVDHAVIFSVQDEKLTYCCTLHAKKDDSLENTANFYRAYIEKRDFSGSCTFKLFPVNVFGQMLDSVDVGSYQLIQTAF